MVMLVWMIIIITGKKQKYRCNIDFKFRYNYNNLFNNKYLTTIRL